MVDLVAQVNCRGYNAFGRRKRREIGKPERDNAQLEDPAQRGGQLREEITIESNAILTFERREERLMDPTEGKRRSKIITKRSNAHTLCVYLESKLLGKGLESVFIL